MKKAQTFVFEIKEKSSYRGECDFQWEKFSSKISYLSPTGNLGN